MAKTKDPWKKNGINQESPGVAVRSSGGALEFYVTDQAKYDAYEAQKSAEQRAAFHADPKNQQASSLPIDQKNKKALGTQKRKTQLTGNQGIIGSMLNLGGNKLLGN